jgi:hypothetical protein
MKFHFNNLQDAGGPRKTLQEALRNPYWTGKGQPRLETKILQLRRHSVLANHLGIVENELSRSGCITQEECPLGGKVYGFCLVEALG